MKRRSLLQHATFSLLLFTSFNLFAESTPQISSRIVGGEEVKNASQYPWIVSIKNTITGGHFCGGSLIDQQWVLTAAHCMEDVTANNIKATVGEYDLSSVPETTATSIDKIIIHPDFNSASLDNDIALIKLSTPVTNTTIATLSKLETADFTAVDTITSTAIGWGSTAGFSPNEKVDPIYPSILNVVSLPLLSTDTCESKLNLSTDKSAPFTNNMVCAGDTVNGGLDSCQGDSGGPLVVESIDQNETQQIGIVSFGFGCGDSDNPGVYTKVANYTEWINNQINGVTSVSNTDYFVADINESKRFTITIENDSENTISPNFSLSDNTKFSLQTTECANLAAKDTCTISFDYTPDAYQTDTTTLFVTTNDDTVSDSTIEIEARGMKSVNATEITFTDNADVTWYQSNSQPWLLSEDDSYLQSPSISDNGSTQITTIISGDWTLSFDWAISSEAEYDYLTLFINGVAIDNISGLQNFTSENYQISGTNTVITWRYTKDESVSLGFDAAFLHNVRVTGSDGSSTSTEKELPAIDSTTVITNSSSNNSNSSNGGSLHWWSLCLLLIVSAFKQPLFRLSLVSSK